MILPPRLEDLRFCAFDVETTGLSFFSRLVEIGAVKFRLDGEAEEFSTLVNPGQPIPPQATFVHGIDDAAVEGAPGAPQAMEEFFAFSRDCLLVAHGAAFDVGVMSVEAARAGLPLPSSPVLDSISLAKTFLPRKRNYRLSTLARALGQDTRNLHRALPDARVAKAVVEAAITSLPQWRSLPPEHLLKKARWVSFDDLAVMEADPYPHMDALITALEEGDPIHILYDGGSKGQIMRKITPTAIFAIKGRFYLEAHCHLDNISKSFRLDRILSVEPAGK